MLARNDGASEPAGVTLTAGTPWKTSEYYIFSVFFLSETLGIDYKDFYLNKGDSCNWIHRTSCLDVYSTQSSISERTPQ